MGSAAILNLRRGFANAIANWELLVIGVGQSFVMMIVTAIAVLLAIVPLIIAGALSAADWSGKTPDGAVRDFVFAHPLMAIYALLVVGIIFLPLMLVYSFFESGKTAVLLRSERTFPPPSDPRNAFDFNAWFSAAARHWWPVFIIVNIVWSVVLLIVLVPLIIAAAVVIIGGGDQAALMAGCAVAVIALLLLIALAIVANVWSQLAILERVESGCGALEACRRSWRLVRANLSEALLTTLGLMALSIGGVLSLVGLQVGIAALAHVPGVGLILIPAQVLVSLAQTAVGALLSIWATGTYAAFRARVT